MRGTTILMLGAIALSAAGCVNTNDQPRKVWSRTDGQRISTNPKLIAQYQVDAQICMGEAAKAAVGAPIVYDNGSLGSMIDAAIVQGQQQQGIMLVAEGCMAQHGYMHINDPNWHPTRAVAAVSRTPVATGMVANPAPTLPVN